MDEVLADYRSKIRGTIHFTIIQIVATLFPFCVAEDFTYEETSDICSITYEAIWFLSSVTLTESFFDILTLTPSERLARDLARILIFSAWRKFVSPNQSLPFNFIKSIDEDPDMACEFYELPLKGVIRKKAQEFFDNNKFPKLSKDEVETLLKTNHAKIKQLYLEENKLIKEHKPRLTDCKRFEKAQQVIDCLDEFATALGILPSNRLLTSTPGQSISARGEELFEAYLQEAMDKLKSKAGRAKESDSIKPKEIENSKATDNKAELKERVQQDMTKHAHHEIEASVKTKFETDGSRHVEETDDVKVESNKKTDTANNDDVFGLSKNISNDLNFNFTKNENVSDLPKTGQKQDTKVEVQTIGNEVKQSSIIADFEKCFGTNSSQKLTSILESIDKSNDLDKSVTTNEKKTLIKDEQEASIKNEQEAPIKDEQADTTVEEPELVDDSFVDLSKASLFVKQDTIDFGEDDEVLVWSSEARLFRLNEGEFKNLGTGEAKLLEEKNGMTRFVFRVGATKKIMANHFVPVHSDIIPKPESQKYSVWSAMDTSLEARLGRDSSNKTQELCEIVFCLKLLSTEKAVEFRNLFLKAQNKVRKLVEKK